MNGKAVRISCRCAAAQDLSHCGCPQSETGSASTSYPLHRCIELAIVACTVLCQDARHSRRLSATCALSESGCEAAQPATTDIGRTSPH